MVDIILRMSFWAVPDFKRVEPVNTSGPTGTSNTYCVNLLISLFVLQERDTLTAPTSFA